MPRAAGNVLVCESTPIHSDVIVISVDSDGAGVLEASDLVHQGLAPGVAIFADPPDAVDREFLRRGLPYHDAAAEESAELHELGVTSVVRMPRVFKARTTRCQRFGPGVSRMPYVLLHPLS